MPWYFLQFDTKIHDILKASHSFVTDCVIGTVHCIRGITGFASYENAASFHYCLVHVIEVFLLLLFFYWLKHIL